jgi:molybdopterin-containing oxidoreductase family iron-sulfur binding subunit
LYVVEPTPSVTGATADNRLPLKANDVELFARALATKIGPSGPATAPAGSEKFLNAVALDLLKHKGAGLVVAGAQQSAEVHALAHLLNDLLGMPARRCTTPSRWKRIR